MAQDTNSQSVPAYDPVRIAEIRQENHGGDVSYRDIDWLCNEVVRLRGVLRQISEDSPQSRRLLWCKNLAKSALGGDG